MDFVLLEMKPFLSRTQYSQSTFRPLLQLIEDSHFIPQTSPLKTTRSPPAGPSPRTGPSPSNASSLQTLKSPTTSPLGSAGSAISPSRRPLGTLKPGMTLSVTDFSAQAWCEKQMELNLIGGVRKETAAMAAGTARHDALERADHEVLDVVIHSREDSLGFRLLNTIVCLTVLLPQNGKVREVWLCMTHGRNGVIRGVIDELEIRSEQSRPCDPPEGDRKPPPGKPPPRGNTDRGKVQRCVVKDTKTRRDKSEPGDAQKRTTAVQLQLYHAMINSIRARELNRGTLMRAFKCSPTRAFEHPILAPFGNLTALLNLFVQAVCEMPPLADYCEVEYDCDGELFSRCRIPSMIPYMKSVLAFSWQYWLGARPATGVREAEKFKCRFCDFLGSCSETPLQPAEISRELEKRQMTQDIEDLQGLDISA